MISVHCDRFIMCSHPAELRVMAKWDGKGPVARGKLMEQLQGKHAQTFNTLRLDTFT